MKLRRILNTDIYNTKDYLNTEYLGLFAKGNASIVILPPLRQITISNGATLTRS